MSEEDIFWEEEWDDEGFFDESEFDEDEDP
jgi:hypothetical protein